jgi:uncharacterized protein YggE
LKIPLAAVVLILTILLAACGGGQGGDGEIRTDKGLGVGLLAVNAERVREGAGQADQRQSGAPVPVETPGTARDVSTGLTALQTAAEGITVSGYGVATANADLAIAEFYFGPYAVPVSPEEPRSGTNSPAAFAAPIDESDLQPVIDAIVAAGVPRADIEFLSTAYYYSGSATLRARVSDIGILNRVIEAATTASQSLADVTLQSTGVSYMVQDCAPLERAALEAAVQDAGERATALADVLSVSRGAVVAASDYAYSPFGGSACNIGYVGPYPLGGATYAETQPQEVQVYASVSITYAIQ